MKCEEEEPPKTHVECYPFPHASEMNGFPEVQWIRWETLPRRARSTKWMGEEDSSQCTMTIRWQGVMLNICGAHEGPNCRALKMSSIVVVPPLRIHDSGRGWRMR